MVPIQGQQAPSLSSTKLHPSKAPLTERLQSGAIEVDMRGAFAGVMQAAGLVERHSLDAALKTKNAPGLVSAGASLSVVAGAGFEPAAFRL